MTFKLWAMLTWNNPNHTLFHYLLPSPDNRSESSRALLRTFLALVGVALLGMLIADFARLHDLVRLQNAARVAMLPGVMLLTLLGTAVIALLPVYLFSGIIIAGQQIGALQRGYRDALRDDLTMIIPGGHRLLLAALGAAIYRHPRSFFGMGLYTATDLHLLSGFGLVGAYAFVLELSLSGAYQPLPVPAEVALRLHPQIIGLCGLLLLLLYVDIRQQLVLGFAAGTAAVYMLPNRGLADAAARLLVIVTTLAGLALMWGVILTYPLLEVIDITRNPLSVLTWGGQLVITYSGLFLVREALIWSLWRGIQSWGKFSPAHPPSDFANRHQK